MTATLTPIPIHINRTEPAMEAVRRVIDSHGLCHLIFDTPGSAANLFTRSSMAELERHLTWIASRPYVHGVLLRSAKPKIFIAGADLHTMITCPPDEMSHLITTGQRVFAALAALPIPKVAAIHGACLGGGCELALACDYRIASDDPATKIGLPETQLGLVPAWGGCTRLPRLIGVRAACQAILKGTAYSAFMAKKIGLVDAIVPAHCLLEQAEAWLMKPMFPHRHIHLDRFVTPVIRALMKRHLPRNYPAPALALELVTRAPWRSFQASLDAEAAVFTSLICQATSRNLIQLFFAKESTKKATVAGKVRPIKRVAIMGAGVMGCGIAYWLAARGRSVLLMDVSAAALAVADQRLRTSCREAVARHILSKTEAAAVLDRIVLSLNDVPLGSVDLLLEAAIEDPAIKTKLFAGVQPRLNPAALLATNTSALPLTGLVEGGKLIGLHFFNPVHAMPLVEIVRQSTASDDDIATAVAFVQSIGKLPLVVKDSPGFLVNRVLMPCLLEAAQMVQEGVSIASVDEAMLRFGMPMGPLRLLDEVGLDVALHVVRTLSTAFPYLGGVPDWLEMRVASGALGRKAGRGYYQDGKPTDHLPIRESDVAAALRRLPLLLTNEAARCLDEGITNTAAEVDLGMVLGTGYAPFRGGPLRHADTIGLAQMVTELRALESTHGPLYAPAQGLVARAFNHSNYHLL